MDLIFKLARRVGVWPRSEACVGCVPPMSEELGWRLAVTPELSLLSVQALGNSEGSIGGCVPAAPMDLDRVLSPSFDIVQF